MGDVCQPQSVGTPAEVDATVRSPVPSPAALIKRQEYTVNVAAEDLSGDIEERRKARSSPDALTGMYVVLRQVTARTAPSMNRQ